MRSHLKVKVFSLSSEMTYIRRQEAKWKKRAKEARKRQQALSDQTKKQQAGDFAVYAMDNFWSQHNHRHQLKVEARTTHLAYGAMKGTPYLKMEQLCYGCWKGYSTSEPDWKAIEGMVERFSKDEINPQEYMQRFAEWLSDAKVWFANNPKRIEEWQKQEAGRRKALLADADYQKNLANHKALMRQRYQK